MSGSEAFDALGRKIVNGALVYLAHAVADSKLILPHPHV
jgi:hypothetical protein